MKANSWEMSLFSVAKSDFLSLFKVAALNWLSANRSCKNTTFSLLSLFSSFSVLPFSFSSSALISTNSRQVLSISRSTNGTATFEAIIIKKKKGRKRLILLIVAILGACNIQWFVKI